MSTTPKALLIVLALAPALVLAQSKGATKATAQPQAEAQAQAQKAAFGFGSTVTESELKRFTSPLPDGRGLPAGSGSVSEGKAVYMQSCASCHGQNLEGGPGDRLIGGRGTLANNDPTKSPIKTIESYWPYATTLFDYIKRAMPFNAPGTLTDDQVYAVSAYILAQAKIIPEDARLDAKSLAAVRMPNRDGFIPDPRPEKFPPATQVSAGK
jgi:mono/diheme cytochrome c family protein